MQVRVPTITISEEERRAIRFARTQRKTMCSRQEAQDFINDAVDRAKRDVMYRLYGDKTPAAVHSGADPEKFANAGGSAAPAGV